MNELVEALARYGLLAVFLNILLQQLGLPIPAVPTLVVAGALAAQGRLSGFGVLGVAFVAAVIADAVWYELGRRYGRSILKLLCRISLSPDSCVKMTDGLFERWDVRSLLLAKFIPGFSTVAPPLAGASGTAFWRFILFTGGGALLWAGSAIAGGMVFHRAVDKVLDLLAGLGKAAIYVVLAALVAYVLVKWWRRRVFAKAFKMARISPEDLHDLVSQGDAPLIVDVRSPNAVQRDPRRVPGAVMLQSKDWETTLATWSPDRQIVLYCT
ncbi:MAG TPA: VTT domain-containing protein [Thermoanaerobaculia bacterium]|jgi:membrane protein DedA with SNARE-associated domain|nr:VTT domain-containing protein [Thermoanaerobaculia bacterium]